MSQSNLSIPNEGGAQFRSDVNAALQALGSNSSGASAPSTTYPNQLWADTSADLLKLRNTANSAWIVLGPLSDLGIQSGKQVVATTGGTADAITLAFTPTMTALTSGPVWWRASSANATTSPTLKRDGLTAKVIRKGNNQPLAVGDVPGAGAMMCSIYDVVNDVEVLLNPASGVSSMAQAGVRGAFSGLTASSTGSSAYVSVYADELAVYDGSRYLSLHNVSVSINSAASGSNGLDSGTLSGSTWYAVWIISNGSTTAGLLSTSASSPTLPSGYTYKARIGWVRTDATANKYLLGFSQSGRRVALKVGSANVSSPPIIASGSAGSFTASVFSPVAASVSSVCPATASAIYIVGTCSTPAVNVLVGVSANSSRGGYTSTYPPELCCNWNAQIGVSGQIFLETGNIYWASTSAACAIACLGWEDNL